jgi:hypothetical protein
LGFPSFVFFLFIDLFLSSLNFQSFIIDSSIYVLIVILFKSSVSLSLVNHNLLFLQSFFCKFSLFSLQYIFHFSHHSLSSVFLVLHYFYSVSYIDFRLSISESFLQLCPHSMSSFSLILLLFLLVSYFLSIYYILILLCYSFLSCLFPQSHYLFSLLNQSLFLVSLIMSSVFQTYQYFCPQHFLIIILMLFFTVFFFGKFVSFSLFFI